MPMIDCGNGHFYNNDEHSTCPYCGVQINLGGGGGEAGGTRRVNDNAGAPPPPRQDTPGMDAGKTRAANTPRPRPDAGEGKTRAYWGTKVEAEIDPVVGWLVCVDGPDRGRDYRIRNGRNFIGRDARMSIAITGDDTISRENHAELIYDPVSRAFFIAPGGGRGLVYLNKAPVLTPTPLPDRAMVQIGKTELMFIPLCGEDFNWETGEEGD